MFETLFNTNLLVAIANIVMAIVAILAVVFAKKQLDSSKQESKISTAKIAYQDYLTLCFQNPIFADGKESQIIRNADDYTQYRWFVAKMLYSFEQIIEALGNDKDWETTLLSQLKYHSWHLNKSESVKRGDWDKRLTILINQAILETYCTCSNKK